MNVLKIQKSIAIPSYNNAFGAVPIMPSPQQRVAQILEWTDAGRMDIVAHISLLISQAMMEKATPVNGRFPTMH